MKDCAATGSPAHEDCLFVFGRAVPVIVKCTEICLQPWILIATDDYTWSICVEEQNARFVWGILQEEVLN
jgi:hypothetical protein